MKPKMTPEEALKDIIESGINLGAGDYVDPEALKVAAKALEKQIPEKLLPEQRYYGIGKCSRCGVVFTDDTTKYCGNCGQAIDWKEGEEDA